MTDRLAQLAAVTAHLDPPYAVIDLDAFDANAAELTRRTGGQATIRVATKSVRARSLIARAAAREGYAGLLAFTLPEALWLAGEGGGDGTASRAGGADVVVGYPTTHRAGLAALAASDLLRERVTLMVDSVDHLDLVDDVLGAGHPPIKVCLDLDASLELLGGRIHLGPWRSPVHAPADAAALAREVVRRPGFVLDGMMSYEGQIAGLGDDQPGARLRRLAVRAMQRASGRELAERRAAAVAAVGQVAGPTALRFVNGGGTGSIEQTSAEPVVTEVAAGSGLYGPGLFDHYRHFQPRPAAYFVLPVVRRPGPRVATALGGGWVASGPPGADRLPTIARPTGLRLSPQEGAGEVQTPLLGAPAARLRLGDQVWLRHSKAGELCERVDELHLVAGAKTAEIVGVVATYRGEGKAFS